MARKRELDWQRLYWEIGFRVRVAREVVGLTQEELAERLGMSRVSITNLELGRQRTPLDTLYRVARVLNVRPHRLLPSQSEVEK